ncbi:TonB-dependent siderophore receptor [Variovorax sp. HJSM1_2]|uniref:TonB-dependent siderophore receptor n=1 Tax=Variovorax sp. HJSM1_2 TaxID=3366263 RepID=UPI003BCB1002
MALISSARPFRPFRLSRVTLGTRSLCFSLALAAGSAAMAQTTPANPAARTASYDIPAGALGPALSRFAASAGITLSFEPTLTDGRSTAGLHGSHTLSSGFSQLLAGSGLEAVPREGGGYTLRRATGASSAAAASAAGATTLGEVQVTAQAERSAITEGSASYTSANVSIGRGDLSLREIPQSISVVTRQRMDDQNLYTLDEVLEATTGVTTFQSPSGGKYYYSRGFLFSTFQYDGVPLERSSYAIGSGFTSDSFLYDRVEVLRGPAGLLQGAGSPGGTLNLVRKRPTAEKTFVFSASAGSWDHYRSTLDASGALNADGSLRGRAGLSAEDQRYFYDTAKSRKNVLYGTLEFDISAATSIAAGVSIEDLDALPYWGGLPRNTDGSAVNVRRSTFTGANWNTWQNTQKTLFADLTHRFNDQWTLKAAGMVLKESNDMQYSFGRGAVNAASGDGMVSRAYLYDFENTNKGLDVNLTGHFSAWGLQQQMVLGANASRLKTDDLAAGLINLGPMNIYNPVSPREPSLSELMNTSYTSYSQRTVRQDGLYGVGRLKLTEPLTLVLGGRVGSYHYQVDSQRYMTGAQASSRMDASHEFTPYGGLIYDLNKNWSTYVSYTDVFQPQGELDAAGQFLKPIKGSNLEAGVKGSFYDGKLNTALALFRIDQVNRAQVDYNADMNCDGWYCSTASGKVRSQGVDAEISGEVLRGLQLFAGYTYTSNKYRSNPEDETQVGQTANSYTPRHLLRVAADYRLPGDLSAWNLGLGANIQSENFHTNYGGTGGVDRITQPGYAVWNARLGYQINKQWSAALNINNLFDKRYFSTIGWLYADNHFGEPRNATLTLRGKF